MEGKEGGEWDKESEVHVEQQGAQYNPGLIRKIHATQSGKAWKSGDLDLRLFSTLEQVTIFEPPCPHPTKERSRSR